MKDLRIIVSIYKKKCYKFKLPELIVEVFEDPMFVELGLPLEGRTRAELAAVKLGGSLRIDLAR